jgi:nitrite reductase (NADH) small subunit
MTLIETDRRSWVAVCHLAVLEPERGVAVLVNGAAVALFRVGDQVLGVSNVDPCSGASILSRGLVGHTDLGDGPVAYVASPLRKERFDLVTGRGLDVDIELETWPVRVLDDGWVEVQRGEASPSGNGPETNP